jgi:putative acetyltransferase
MCAMTDGAPFTIRPSTRADDGAIARIIRAVMPEFGASGPGFAINDPEVDEMYAAYSAPRHAYFVVERDGAVLGGGGVAPLTNGAPHLCELRKMYFMPALRGLGAGRALIDHCLDVARGFGFTQCSLETLTGMDAAQKLYLASGFRRIPAAMGNTGHFSCDRFFLRDL